MITSEIRVIDGNPTLFINGEQVLENAYITYFIKKARYGDFAEAGYKLYSVPLYFATRGIQEINEIPPFDDGVFENKDAPDFSIVDRAVNQILEACPDAYIFPRVNMSLPLWWERENPDELCDYGNISMDKRRPCYSSDKWLAETKRELKLFIEHIENSPYRDHICAYQLAGGNAEEWFGLDQKGSIGKRSREKFEQYKIERGIEGTEAEYYYFLSEICADRIIELCEYAKELTGHRLVMGSFYGYIYDRQDRESDHHALGKVLKSPSVDFLCSPVSYMDERALGRDLPCMMPLESLKKHGKLYFVENDVRTHLSGPLFDIPHFHNVHYRPRERWYSVEAMKMCYSKSLIKSHPFWWFDMGGGWHNYPLYMEMDKDFIEITRSAHEKDRSGVSEVAVLVDERVFSRFDREGRLEKVTPITYHFRNKLGVMGAPYDTYIAEDFDLIKDSYKAFILIEPEESELSLKIKKEAKNCLLITPDKKDITAEELRRFLKEKGVHLYSESDLVVYVNKSYLFFHTTDNGKVNINLPDGKKLRQIYGDKVDLDKHILPAKTGYLFEIVDAER